MNEDSQPILDEEDDSAKKRRKTERSQREQAADDLRGVMALPGGRRFVREMLNRCGVWRLSYAGEQTHATAFNEGKRAVGNQLLLDLESAAPVAFIDMLREAQQSRK